MKFIVQKTPEGGLLFYSGEIKERCKAAITSCEKSHSASRTALFLSHIITVMPYRLFFHEAGLSFPARSDFLVTKLLLFSNMQRILRIHLSLEIFQ